MEERRHSNAEVKRPSLFAAVNNYFLLLFGASCLISSLYIQQVFVVLDQYRIGISIAAFLGIILPVYFLTRRFGGGVRLQFRISAPRSPQFVFVLLATLCSVVIVDHIYIISQQFRPVPEHYMEALQSLKPTSVWAFALVFLGMCALADSCSRSLLATSEALLDLS